MSNYGLQIWNDEGVKVLDVDEGPSRVIYSVAINHVQPNLTFDLTPYLPAEPVDMTAIFQADHAGMIDHGAYSEIDEPYQVFVSGNQLRISWNKTNSKLQGTAIVLAI